MDNPHFRKLYARFRVRRRGKVMCFQFEVPRMDLMKHKKIWMVPPMVCERMPSGDLMVVGQVNRWGNGRGGRPWRRTVERIKARDQYTCQVCGRITQEGDVDHIISLSKAKTKEDELRLGKDSNLQYICRIPCHRDKTLRESGVTVKQPIGLDGWPT